jgi:hypothetical protein
MLASCSLRSVRLRSVLVFAGTPTVMYVDEPRPAFEDES